MRKTIAEKNLCIDIREDSIDNIIGVFKLAASIQLPVVENNKIIGLVDIFDILAENKNVIDIEKLVNKDIDVVGLERGIHEFGDTEQNILPFVDENKNFSGFTNKNVLRCYVPSEEYSNAVEQSIRIRNDADTINDSDIESFDVILEPNYEGRYLTLDTGKTVVVNEMCTYLKELNYKNISLENDENATIQVNGVNEQCSGTVRVMQNIQKRTEISMSDKNIFHKGIIRISNNNETIHELKKEMNKKKKLVDKYKTQIEMLKKSKNSSKKMVFDSPEMKQVYRLCKRVANVDSTVLLTGETGVGKSMLANVIHNSSNRKNEIFVSLDCGTIPESLIESELFGHEKGAFTGAYETKKGLLEIADTGTLFLDEIGELNLDMQVKLLRVLQEREIQRIGGIKPISINVRIISATNKNLKKLVSRGEFREDLYYRLSVVPIKVPSLRERKEDIEPLLMTVLDYYNERYNQDKKLHILARKCLMEYSWPGNIRELENVIEYLAVTTMRKIIMLEDIPKNICKQKIAHNEAMNIDLKGRTLKETLESLEKEMFRVAVRKSRKTQDVAEILMIDRSTVSKKMIKYDLSFD